MNDTGSFFITTLPDSRPADYYSGCLEGSVFMDFNDYTNGLICIKRISFDGHGCWELKTPIAMSESDSRSFKEIIATQLSDQDSLLKLIKKTVVHNKKIPLARCMEGIWPILNNLSL